MDYKESDVEAAFCEWLDKQPNYRTIGRQIELPLGRMDVLGLHHDGLGPRPVIVEVKRGAIDRVACGQLIGYIGQVQYLIQSRLTGALMCEAATMPEQLTPIGILVGASLDPYALRIVKTTQVRFCRFTLEGDSFRFEFDQSDYIDEEYSDIDDNLSVLLELITSWCTKKLIEHCRLEPQFDDTHGYWYGYGYSPKLEDTLVYWQAKSK